VAASSQAIWLYHWYRFFMLDIAMHLLILLVVRVLRFQAAVKAVFRWIAPACVIRNWRVTGPSSSQLVMEHELFRHIEIELFVQRHYLPNALSFLERTLTVAANARDNSANEFRNQLAEANCTDNLEKLRGQYCHHYPICVRKILPDDTLVSMASNVSIASEHGTDTREWIGLSGDQAWYSITLTNYDRGQRRKRFEELASFLCISMKCLFDARPHWGKLCPLTTDALRSLYPAFNDFRHVCDQADKEGVFRNPWARNLLRSDSSVHDL
jgi:hypothetical protein